MISGSCSCLGLFSIAARAYALRAEELSLPEGIRGPIEYHLHLKRCDMLRLVRAVVIRFKCREPKVQRNWLILDLGDEGRSGCGVLPELIL
ncbi:hypothetical protein BHE74_00033653 [Ensete ventricosum]|nr:hypothetical protein BHE74_00033653 [Ensete ventricosum]RZS11216.1 hypothetical protein BHM03_00042530 [Ensete ventricosum]